MNINRTIQLAVLALLLAIAYHQWTSQTITAAAPPLPQYEVALRDAPSYIDIPFKLAPGEEPFAVSNGSLYVRRRIN